MWKAYLKADAWILSKTQDFYLWLLDRTGVYVATCGFAIYAGICTAELLNGGTLWLWLPLLALVGLTMGPKYLMQDRAEHVGFNFIASSMEAWRWRHGLNAAITSCVLLGVILLEPLTMVANLGFLLYGYLMLVRIRDRDKKPFFKPVEKLAVQHGSN
jgi:hypothetical protein